MIEKIILSKSYEFEGETYTEIDLQGMNDLKAKDLSEIDKIFAEKGGNPVLSGLTLDYAMIVAHRVTKKPIEFFENLPARDATTLKNEVVSFFYGED
jgi:hypothetical protein